VFGLGVGNLGRRLVESVVGLFALLGFVYVPLGRHTGFEHAKAVLSTPQAADAYDDLSTAALDLRKRVLDFVTGRKPEPLPPTEPSKAAKAGAAPRPVPPKLN
jgi:hypothetical protein